MNADKLPNQFSNQFEGNFTNTNEFKLLEPNENKYYSISINKSEQNIKIEAYQVNNLNTHYKVELNLNEFYQLSKGFKMCDNLGEICDLLINMFLSKKVSLVKKSKNLFIILKVSSMDGKEQEINIELNSETSKDNYYTNTYNIKINQLENEIKELKNEIKELKNDKNILLKKINELENKIDNQNKEIDNLENTIFVKIKNLENKIYEKINNIENNVNKNNKIERINNIEKELKEQKDKTQKIIKWKNEYNTQLQQIQKIKINNITLNKIDSLIINKYEELEFLENRLKYNNILKDKNIIFKLLYRSSRDGSNTQTFHNKCDNIMGTLSIIKTTKGMRFGGYTEQYWGGGGSNGTFKKDAKNICFCFSLDLFKIYNFNDNYNSSIYCRNDCGPDFCSSNETDIFYICKNNGSLIGSTNYKTNHNSFGKFDYDYEINNGQRDFSVAELEVFQILFDN